MNIFQTSRGFPQNLLLTILFLVTILANAFASPATDNLEAITKRVHILLKEGLKKNKSKVEETVSLMRSLHILSLNSTPDSMEIVIPTLLKASVTPSLNNKVSSEANITLNAIGYGPAAIRAYASVLRQDDIPLERAALKIIEEKTRGNRKILKENGLDIILEEWVRQAKIISSPPPPLMKEVWAIIKSPELDDLTLDTKLKAIFVAETEWPYIFSWPINISGAEKRRRLLTEFEKVLNGYEIQKSRVGVPHNSLWPYILRIYAVTDILIRNKNAKSKRDVVTPFNSSVWDEVNSFQPSIKKELTDRLLKNLVMELKLMTVSKPLSRKKKKGSYLAHPQHILLFLPLLGKDATLILPHLMTFSGSAVWDSGARGWFLKSIKEIARASK